MNTRLAVLIGLALAALAFAGTAWIYPSLPERIPTHWNLHGEVDEWGSRFPAAFFGPIAMLLFTLLLVVLPRVSPERFRVDAFRDTFNYVMVAVIALFALTHGITLDAARHPDALRARWLVAGIFLFFAVIGNVLGKVRRNFWMGVRTPWTLASDHVWVATHRLAARIFVAAGVGGAAAILLGAPFVAGFALLMVAVAVPALYSLVLSKRIERGAGTTAEG